MTRLRICLLRVQVQNAFLLSHVDEHAVPSWQRAAGNSCGAACMRSAFPFSRSSTSVLGVPTIRYIEIDITKLGSKGKISVGVVSSKYAIQWMRSGNHLGIDSGPWEDSYDVRTSCPKSIQILRFAVFSVSNTVLVCLQSVGWHVHSGVLYPDKADVKWHARGAEFAPAVAAGAVLGCGMDILGNSLFYTLNGAVIGSVLPAGRQRTAIRFAPCT
jgi:hypothetical protein